MKITRKKILTVGHFFFLILFLSTLSLLLNYNVGTNDVIIEGNADTNANDFKTFFKDESDVNFLRRSLNQHAPEEVEKATIHMKLTKLEQQLESTRSQGILLVVKDKHQEQLYSQVVIGLNTAVVVQNTDQLSWLDIQTFSQSNWTAMFCVDSRKCPEKVDNQSTKIGRIRGMESIANDEGSLCRINKHFERVKNKTTSTICDVGEKESRDASPAAILRRKDQSPSVQWHLPSQPVHYPGGHVLRVTVLLTSLHPVRLYVHPDMATTVHQSQGRHLTKTTLSDILQNISETHGLESPGLWWATIQDTVAKAIVLLANDVIIMGNHICRGCFQLLDVDIICSHVTSCYIVKVDICRNVSITTIEDTLRLVAGVNPVSHDVISSVNNILSRKNISLCSADLEPVQTNNDCLTLNEIIYIRGALSERRNIGQWIHVLLGDDISIRKYVENIFGQSQNGALPSRLVTMTIREIMPILYPEDPDIQYMRSVKPNHDAYHNLTADIMAINCSQDGVDYGKIGHIFTIPKLNQTSMPNRVYVTYVPYDVILINVYAVAKHCACDVRIVDFYNSPRPKNFTVGLGETRLKFLVVDKTEDHPRVIQTYSLVIYRKSRGDEVTRDVKNITNLRKICKLHQDCSMGFNRTEPCGLQESTSLERRPQTTCNAGDHIGNWLVLCDSCYTRDPVCDWQKSIWQPRDCSYIHVTSLKMKACLRGKRLLFLGDSTNRGILNYVVEKANDTLWDGDKTHSTRVYNDVNNGSTVVSFAYYPHFWLPSDHRPTFRKILYQIIKRSLPLENNPNTVLMVGGVQWLAQHHIDLILEVLKSKGLSNVTMVIKGFGAGFHQPLDDVRFVPASEQTTLKRREDSLLTYAKSRGFKVVATFQMTLARYKDFQEGKCACHFHKVSRLKNSYGVDARYTVEGDINEAYSQIFLNQICNV